jgi:hypothetical protein
MEYMHLGDLEKMLTHPLPEDEAVRIARQLNEGLIYMHEHDIVHRDLKPSVSRDQFKSLYLMGGLNGFSRTSLFAEVARIGGLRLATSASPNDSRRAIRKSQWLVLFNTWLPK